MSKLDNSEKETMLNPSPQAVSEPKVPLVVCDIIQLEIDINDFLAVGF